MIKKIEFETFRDIGSYEINNLTKKEPSCINFLSYKKTKVTIEEIEEDNSVYIERLKTMLATEKNHRYITTIKSEIEKLSKL